MVKVTYLHSKGTEMAEEMLLNDPKTKEDKTIVKFRFLSKLCKDLVFRHKLILSSILFGIFFFLMRLVIFVISLPTCIVDLSKWTFRMPMLHRNFAFKINLKKYFYYWNRFFYKANTNFYKSNILKLNLL